MTESSVLAVTTKCWYETPLYYDITFTEEYNRADVSYMLTMFSLHGRTGTTGPLTIIEPACGTGRVIPGLCRAGHFVCGFDLGQSMLDYAADRMRREGVECFLWKDDMGSFELPEALAGRRFDLASNYVSSFKYVTTEEGAHGHLVHMAKVMKPGGIYLVNLHLAEYDQKESEVEDWHFERDGVSVHATLTTGVPDPVTRLEPAHMLMRATEGGVTRQHETSWFFRTYSRQEVLDWVAKVPEWEIAAFYDLNETETQRSLQDKNRQINVVLRRK